MELVLDKKYIIYLQASLIVLASILNFKYLIEVSYIITFLMFIYLSFIDNKFRINIFLYTLVIGILTFEFLLYSFYGISKVSLLPIYALINFYNYNILFDTFKSRLNFSLIFMFISFIFLFPNFHLNDIRPWLEDSTLVTRNLPTYIFGIFSNLAILNLSNFQSEIDLQNPNIRNKKNHFFLKYKNLKFKIDFIQFFSFFILIINILALKIFFKNYSASLGSILFCSLSIFSMLFFQLSIIKKDFLLKLKKNKFVIFTLFAISTLIFIKRFDFSEFFKFYDSLVYINFKVPSGGFESYRTDFVGFLRCFLKYPFGTGFYGMEKLCIGFSGYDLPGGIMPHNLIIQSFLAYPLLFIFSTFALLSKKVRLSLQRIFLLNTNLDFDKRNKFLILLAKFFHASSFLLCISLSETHLIFPYL